MTSAEPYDVQLSPAAARGFKKFPPTQQDRIQLPPRLAEDVADTVDALSIDPEAVGTALRGRLSGLWVARGGGYRVVYTIEGSTSRRRAVVRAVRHRAVVYRPR